MKPESAAEETRWVRKHTRVETEGKAFFCYDVASALALTHHLNALEARLREAEALIGEALLNLDEVEVLGSDWFILTAWDARAREALEASANGGKQEQP